MNKKELLIKQIKEQLEEEGNKQTPIEMDVALNLLSKLNSLERLVGDVGDSYSAKAEYNKELMWAKKALLSRVNYIVNRIERNKTK